MIKILILGYSDLCQRKVIPVLKKNVKKFHFSVCSKSKKIKNIGAYACFKNYDDALRKSNADIVYISLINSSHYYWAKKSLKYNYHVIIDKPATINFKQAKELVKLAKIKRKLLSEAITFQEHSQIKKALREIKSLNKIKHVEAKFIIPKLERKNFRNFKNLGGGCILDMGPYAASVFRMFIDPKDKKYHLSHWIKKSKKGLDKEFKIYAYTKKKTFVGHFSHMGDYENTLTLFTTQKKVIINRAFSPPNNENLTLLVNDDRIKKIKKDNAFLNYFNKIINLLKNKKFENSYKVLLKDSFFREKLIT